MYQEFKMALKLTEDDQPMGEKSLNLNKLEYPSARLLHIMKKKIIIIIIIIIIVIIIIIIIIIIIESTDCPIETRTPLREARDISMSTQF